MGEALAQLFADVLTRSETVGQAPPRCPLCADLEALARHRFYLLLDAVGRTALEHAPESGGRACRTCAGRSSRCWRSAHGSMAPVMSFMRLQLQPGKGEFWLEDDQALMTRAGDSIWPGAGVLELDAGEDGQSVLAEVGGTQTVRDVEDVQTCGIVHGDLDGRPRREPRSGRRRSA